MSKTAHVAVALITLLAACSSSGTDSTGTAATTPDTTVVTTESPRTTPITDAPESSQADTTTQATDVEATDPATTEVDTTAVETSQVETTDVAATTTGADTTVAPTQDGPLTIQELLDLGRPIVLAHAGGEDQHPHSTPYAFAESVEAGVDMLDFDVQLTADGVLVVQHDDDTERTTNANLVIAESDYADLAKLDNAYWFTTECTCKDRPDSDYVLRGMRTGDVTPLAGYAPDDFAIPKFEDIVRRFPNMPVNIEIKGSGAQAIAAAYELARILIDEGLADNAVVTSFDDLVVEAFHELAPEIEVTPGLNLSSAFILNGVPLPEGMRILQLPPIFGDIEVLSDKNIAASHAAGYVIWVWPNDRALENPAAYTEFLERGMDGLNINFPADGVQAVRAFTGEGSD